MQKDIDTMVLENVFGKIETKENKESIEQTEANQRKGFYIDSFYVTGMCYREYKNWASIMKRARGNYLFWQ